MFTLKHRIVPVLIDDRFEVETIPPLRHRVVIDDPNGFDLWTAVLEEGSTIYHWVNKPNRHWDPIPADKVPALIRQTFNQAMKELHETNQCIPS